MANTRKYDYTAFVKVWTLANSVKEAADKLGMTELSARMLAARLKAKGVKLKKFSQSQVEVAALNKLITEAG
jgi:hypothetical protein